MVSRNAISRITLIKRRWASSLTNLIRGQPAGSGQITFTGADITKEPMAIGWAILSNPKLLLLDEPTEGIRPSLVDQIKDVDHWIQTSATFCDFVSRVGAPFCGPFGGEVCGDSQRGGGGGGQER